MEYDLIVKNAAIVTMDGSLRRFSGWVGVNRQVITAVEEGDCPASGKCVVDAQGATLLPGLTDCHLHVVQAGMNYCEPQLGECTCIQDVLDIIGEACENEPGGGWVFGFGLLIDRLAEKRYPTKYELDSVSHGHKVAVCSATLHGYALNSWGVEVVSIPDDTPGVAMKDGVQLGCYTSDESSLRVSSEMYGDLSDAEILKYLNVTVNEGLKKGATTLHTLCGETVKNDRDFKVLFDHQDELGADTVIWYQNWNPDDAKRYGLKRVGGCLTLDGVTFEHTQANYKPFVTAPHLRGVLYHTDNEVYNFISRAWELDMQTTMHCVGERAVDQLLYAYLRVIGEQGQKDLRPRIEHFCQSTDEQIAMAKELGVTLSMQPSFSYYWHDGFVAVLGEERTGGTEAYGKVVRAGVTLLGGSDCPVTPIDPLLGIATLVRGPDERRHISVDDAIRAYTTNPAWSTKTDDVKGSIEVGKVADLVLIDKNPYEYADSDELFDMRVLKTIRHGAIAYDAQAEAE